MIAASPAAKTIRQWRQERGYTLAELSERVDVALMTVWRWERGDFVPRGQHLRDLARSLGVSVDEIALAGDDESRQGDAE